MIGRKPRNSFDLSCKERFSAVCFRSRLEQEKPALFLRISRDSRSRESIYPAFFRAPCRINFSAPTKGYGWGIVQRSRFSKPTEH